ncbi:MAG: cellulose binding domain-containing protein [Polyangiaceae bacterium]
MKPRYVHALCLSMIGTSLGACNGEPEHGGGVTELAASAYSSNGVNVVLAVTSDWGSGYCATVTLSNTSSAPVTNWTVQIALNQSTLGNLWSASSSVSGGMLTVTPAGFNSTISANGQSSFGFCANAPSAALRPTVSSATIVGGVAGAGGASSVGGTTAKGGTTSVGGMTAKGGTTSVGGTTSKGGTTSVGGTTSKGGSTSVGGSSGAGQVFNQCRFHFGTIDSVAKSAGSSMINQLDFFTPGWMMNASFDQKYVCDEGNPGGALANQVPMIVTYIAANYVKNYMSPKLCDCNVSSCGSTGNKINDLCNFGAERIAANWTKIIDAYKNYSAGYAACYGTTRPIVFKMEPDWYQYTGSSQSAPWTAAQAGSRMSELVKALKTSLPNARFAIDVSPWVAPSNGSDNGSAWFANFDMSLFSFVATSGGGTNANTTQIRSSNNMTWAGLNRATGKPILADTGYGANGISAGHDPAWDVATNVNSRIADGVIAIAQYNPNSNWGTTIASLRSQLKSPKYCP